MRCCCTWWVTRWAWIFWYKIHSLNCGQFFNSVAECKILNDKETFKKYISFSQPLKTPLISPPNKLNTLLAGTHWISDRIGLKNILKKRILCKLVDISLRFRFDTKSIQFKSLSIHHVNVPFLHKNKKWIIYIQITTIVFFVFLIIILINLISVH